MVEVHLHLLVVQTEHATEEVVAVLILQGYDGILEDMFMIKMTVDAEHFAVKIQYVCRINVAISLVLSKFKTERFILCQTCHLGFKGIERYAKTAYKLERASVCGFLHQFLLSIFHRVQFVCHGNVLVLCFIHVFIYTFNNGF